MSNQSTAAQEEARPDLTLEYASAHRDRAGVWMITVIAVSPEGRRAFQRRLNHFPALNDYRATVALPNEIDREVAQARFPKFDFSHGK